MTTLLNKINDPRPNYKDSDIDQRKLMKRIDLTISLSEEDLEKIANDLGHEDGIVSYADAKGALINAIDDFLEKLN